MKDEWRMMKNEWWMIKDDDLKLLRGFDYGQMDKQTDICDCRVTFATENNVVFFLYDIYNQVCFFFRLLLCKIRLTVNSFLTWLVVAWCELSLHDYDCAHNKIFPAAIKRASTEYNKSSHLINTSALSNRMREMDKMQ